MNAGIQFVCTEVAAIGSLVILALLLAAANTIHAGLSTGGMFSPVEVGQIYFFGTLIFGFVPTAFFGAPTYFLLSRSGRARWPWVMAVAMLPSALLIGFDARLAAITLPCAWAVAALTHLACRKWVRPHARS